MLCDFFLCFMSTKDCNSCKDDEYKSTLGRWDWFELVKIKGDTIRFRIYNDYTLEKIVDADFVGDGCLDYLKKENWSDYISGYDGINIHLIVVKNYKNLKLYKLKTYYEDCYE